MAGVKFSNMYDHTQQVIYAGPLELFALLALTTTGLMGVGKHIEL
jgi:hypothetical protein